MGLRSGIHSSALFAARLLPSDCTVCWETCNSCGVGSVGSNEAFQTIVHTVELPRIRRIGDAMKPIISQRQNKISNWRSVFYEDAVRESVCTAVHTIRAPKYSTESLFISSTSVRTIMAPKLSTEDAFF
jgi:hypothetical protein